MREGSNPSFVLGFPLQRLIHEDKSLPDADSPYGRKKKGASKDAFGPAWIAYLVEAAANEKCAQPIGVMLKLENPKTWLPP